MLEGGGDKDVVDCARALDVRQRGRRACSELDKRPNLPANAEVNGVKAVRQVRVGWVGHPARAAAFAAVRVLGRDDACVLNRAVCKCGKLARSGRERLRTARRVDVLHCRQA